MDVPAPPPKNTKLSPSLNPRRLHCNTTTTTPSTPNILAIVTRWSLPRVSVVGAIHVPFCRTRLRGWCRIRTLPVSCICFRTPLYEVLTRVVRGARADAASALWPARRRFFPIPAHTRALRSSEKHFSNREIGREGKADQYLWDVLCGVCLRGQQKQWSLLSLYIL